KKSPHSSTYVSGRGFRSRAPEGLEFVTLKTPIVYHLYGDSSQPESLILTEDDYLQFLFEIGQDTAVFPPEITRRLARGSYLFIGHDQSDLGFRVLLQGFLARFLENKTGSYIQLTPNSSAFTQNPKHAEQYFSAMGMKIYWGSAYQFTAELLRNWRLFSL
ncbi:MAG TPA: SIR2 family protein, partial [Pyrinomonadaceae bacterium]|nr:SIR2 family protein [Pyrinomonadaceae bacterium]